MGGEEENGNRQWGAGGESGIDRGSGVGGERVGIDRRSGVEGGESGDRQEEWGGRGRVGIDSCGVGKGETGEL